MCIYLAAARARTAARPNLQDKLDTLLAENRKQGRHSVFYYLFYILLLLFFLISFMSEL